MHKFNRRQLLAATAAGLALAAAIVSQTALAAGPPAGVNFTATDSFVLKADQPSVTCYLHAKPGNFMPSCTSAGEFGSVRTDEDTNSIWFQPKPYYAIPTGNLVYQAKGHPDVPVNWYGEHHALSRTIGGVRYHVTMGHIKVLKAAVIPATHPNVALTATSSTTRHAANVQVSLVLSGWQLREQLKFNGHYYTGCQLLRPNPCGGFKDYGPVAASVGFIHARGENFVYGTGWRKYTFPEDPNFVSCTVDVWYGTETKEHNVTACGHKHGELVAVGATLGRA